MLVEIDDESKKWLEAKGSQLTIKLLEVDACCAPPVHEVVAIPGKPSTSADYNQLKVDNLSIYVQNKICNKEKLTLKLSGFSLFKTISAKLQ